MVSQYSLTARYEFGHASPKKQKQAPKPERVFGQYDAGRVLDDAEFDHKIEPALKALDIIYAHSLQQDKKGQPLWGRMQKALDRILNMPIGKFDQSEHYNLMRAALWLHVDRGTRDQTYESALKMLEFFSQRTQQGLVTPPLTNMATLEEYKADLDSDRVMRKADYWPLLWVKPQERAKLLQHIAETNHPLMDQTLEIPVRQLIYKAFARMNSTLADDRASLREIYKVATEGASGNPALKTLRTKMQFRHTNGDDYWLALDAA